MGSNLYSQRWRYDGPKRKKRPKTFKTEEKAKAWAEKNKIKDYELVKIREDKIKVVEKKK